MSENVIQVNIYYYIDEQGNKIYDEEEMTREFYEKLKELKEEEEEDDDFKTFNEAPYGQD